VPPLPAESLTFTSFYTNPVQLLKSPEVWFQGTNLGSRIPVLKEWTDVRTACSASSYFPPYFPIIRSCVCLFSVLPGPLSSGPSPFAKSGGGKAELFSPRLPPLPSIFDFSTYAWLGFYRACFPLPDGAPYMLFFFFPRAQVLLSMVRPLVFPPGPLFPRALEVPLFFSPYMISPSFLHSGPRWLDQLGPCSEAPQLIFFFFSRLLSIFWLIPLGDPSFLNRRWIVLFLGRVRARSEARLPYFYDRRGCSSPTGVKIWNFVPIITDPLWNFSIQRAPPGG